MRVRVTGIDELKAQLDAVVHTLMNIGVTSAIPDAVLPAISAELIINWQTRGRRLADGIQDGGRMPWGTYAKTWESSNPAIGTKEAGEVYWLIETEDLIKSMTEVNDPNQRLDQSARSVSITSLVPYAGKVQAKYGAYIAAGQTMKEAVEEELEQWLVANLPGAWTRS